MKLKGKWFFLLIAVLLYAMPLSAQQQTKIDSLSTDSEQFFQQVSSFLMSTPSKTWQDKSQELLDRFYASWSVGRFNKE